MTTLFQSSTLREAQRRAARDAWLNDRTYGRQLDAVATAMAHDVADEFACLETHNCVSPGGHLFLSHGVEEVCLHCRRVSWRR